MSMLLKEIKIPQKDVYTYADYAMLPEGAPYQLIGGKLIMTPSPTTYHQDIVVCLVEKLLNFNAKEKAGKVYVSPIDVYLEDKETYQPDVIFISKDRLHIIESAKINGAPDLVMEILSPSTAYYDLKEKFKVYARHGVKEYWIIDPKDKSIEVYEGNEGKFKQVQRMEEEGKAKSSILKGFEVNLKDIF